MCVCLCVCVREREREREKALEYLRESIGVVEEWWKDKEGNQCYNASI